MRATKLIKSIKHLTYTDRLKHLLLPTLRYRRIRGDIILVFKILTGIIHPNVACTFNPVINSVTRGNSLKLFQNHVPYDLNKYFFSNRIISLWNSLPNYVVSACSVKVFEIRLDSFWKNQLCIYDYKQAISGTGSRSLNN
jgi:hypothetical protein